MAEKAPEQKPKTPPKKDDKQAPDFSRQKQEEQNAKQAEKEKRVEETAKKVTADLIAGKEAKVEAKKFKGDSEALKAANERIAQKISQVDPETAAAFGTGFSYNEVAAQITADILTASPNLRNQREYWVYKGVQLASTTGDLSPEAKLEARVVREKIAQRIQTLSADKPDAEQFNQLVGKHIHPEGMPPIEPPKPPEETTAGAEEEEPKEKKKDKDEVKIEIHEEEIKPDGHIDDLINEEEMLQLQHPEIRQIAEDLQRQKNRDPSLLDEPERMRKIREHLTERKDIPSEAEQDLAKLIGFLREKESIVSESMYSLGLNREEKAIWQNLKAQSRKNGEILRGMHESIERNAYANNQTPPAEFLSALGQIESAMDPGRAGQVSPQEIAKHLQNLSGKKELQDYLGAEMGTLGGMLGFAEQQKGFIKSMQEKRIDRRLEQAGIKETRLLHIYDELTEPHRWQEKLNGLDQSKAQDFYDKLSTDSLDLAQNLLRVADTDPEQYFDHLFTSFWHEPVYSNIITGIADIKDKVLDWERKQREQGKDVLKVQIKVFNYDKQAYELKEFDLSKALDRLQEKITAEKDWKSYMHNIYVLMLNRAPLETYKDYTKSLKTSSIDILLMDNPALEAAVRYHMSYVRTKYGLGGEGEIGGWKTPVEPIYTLDKNIGDIPVDHYVKEKLRELKVENNRGELVRLTNEEIDRLTSFARGYAIGVSWEGIDAMASGGPVREGKLGGGRFTGFFGPLADFNQNRYVWYRWGSRIPNNEYLYTRIRGKGNNQPWDVRRELHDALETQQLRVDKEPPRVVTKKMVDEGIPFIEDTYFSMVGGLEMRQGWRQAMYEHLIVPGNHEMTVKNLMAVNLSAANRYIEDKYGNDVIKIEKRNELRGMILEHMAQIAPQEFLILENDLTLHPKMKEFSHEQIQRLSLEAAKVTDFLLENTKGGKVMTSKDLTPQAWEELFKDASLRSQVQRFWNQSQELGKFITHNTWKYQKTLPWKEKGEPVKKDFSFTLEPWKEAEYIRSFPTHLAVKRNANWSVLKENVVDRLAGDNDIISKALSGYWKVVPDIMKEYQADPNRAKQEKFAKYIAELQKVWNGYQLVHGESNAIQERASCYRISYQLAMLFDKYYAKSIEARMPLGIGSGVSWNSIFSSWAHYSVGEPGTTVLQFDEQMHRVFQEELVKRMLIAPPHGWVQNIGKVEERKFGFGPFKYKFKLDHVPWNGADFVAESGGRWWQVGIDIARSAIPLVLMLVMLSAMGKVSQDSGGGGGHH